MSAIFENLEQFSAIIDVRTPAEYALDHIPGAENMPVLSDEQRRITGLLYKRDAFAGRRRGAGLVAQNIAALFSGALAARPADWRPLVYCWRGGMRSGALVQVMREVGWRAEALPGGYKAYRQSVIAALAGLPGRFSWQVVSGPTGSGKSLLLASLEKLGAQIVDLEGIARHRGSVFGTMSAQPSQRSFETALRSALAGLDAGRPVFVEAESPRLGALEIPRRLLEAIRSGRRIWIEANRRARARLTSSAYREYRDRDTFAQVVSRLHRHVGAARIDEWMHLHAKGEFEQLAEGMLADYYDPKYAHALRRHRQSGQKEEMRMEFDPCRPEQIENSARQIIARCAGQL